MSTPVSVVMTTCNGEDFLVEQIESILNQLEPEDEMIVVDDASHDGTRRMLQHYSGHQVRILLNDSNIGVMKSIERGLNSARFDIIFLSDQDDIWLPGKRTSFVDAFAKNLECTIVISDAEVIDETGILLTPLFMPLRGGFRSRFLANLIRNRYLGCAMAIHRRLLKKALPIPASAPMHDMWLGAIGSLSGTVCYLPQPFIQYRRHNRNQTPLESQPLGRMLKWRWNLLRDVASRMIKLHLSRVV